MPAHPASDTDHSTEQGMLCTDPSAEEHLAHSSNEDFEVGESSWKDSPPSSFDTGEITLIFSRSCTFQEPQSTTSPFPQGRGRRKFRELGMVHGNPIEPTLITAL